jgi:hypothetical protein
MTAPRRTQIAVAAAAVSAALVAGMTGTAIAFEDGGGGPDEPADPIACVPRPRQPSTPLQAVVPPHPAPTAMPGSRPATVQPSTTPPMAAADLHLPRPLDAGTGTGCADGLDIRTRQGVTTARIPAPRTHGRTPEPSGR